MKLFAILLLVFPFVLPAQAPTFPGAKGLPDFEIPGSGSTHHTRVRLVPATETFVPGETLTVGVVLEMDPHWHTYWINPGDSGMPTTIDWELPEGFEAGEIQWPTPERFMLGGLVSLGYEGTAVLRVPIETAELMEAGTEVSLRATVNWLECKEVCLPGDAEVEATVRAAESVEGPVRSELAASEGALSEDVSWSAAFRSTAEGAEVRIQAPEGAGPFVEFFPRAEGVWKLEPAPEVRVEDGTIAIRLISARENAKDPEEISGVLVTEEGQGYRITAGPAESASPGGAATGEEGAQGLLPVLVTALIGGVLLNLLPCVFPVLGLKISGFIEQAHGDPKKAKLHSLVFAAGILVSLWILAAVVSALNLAWGGQLGDPTTNIALILLLSLFSFNLFGVFEVGHMFTRMGGDLTRKSGYSGSFFSGVLVTVIATPCTAPFMAGAIGWALTQPAAYAFLAFTALGIGIALPYVVLSFSPKLLEKMPRPGPWMETFKQASGFLMIGFVWVMLWVLSALIPAAAVVRVVGAVCLVGMAAWVLGKWGALHRSTGVRRTGQAATVALLVLAGYTAYSYEAPATDLTSGLQARIDAGEPVRYDEVEPELAAELREEGVNLHWTPYSPERLEALREEGTPVFVDFTAKWCFTCQVNKRTTLHKDEVMKAFDEKGVVTLKADLTKDDPVIKRALRELGRQGVPAYALYDGEGGEPVLRPEVLTPGIVKNALDEF